MGRRVIVDSQIHLWKENSEERPWVPGFKPQLPQPMTIERFVPLLDAAGVDKAVVVPPALDGIRHDYGQEAARRYPGRFATMSRVKLRDPSEAERIQNLRSQDAVLGLRLWPGKTDLAVLEDGTADWLWPIAEAAGLPIMVLTLGQSHLLGKVAEAHPELRLIIDHMGVTDEALNDGSTAVRVAEAAALSVYPNVSVKLSSAPLLSREKYPWRDVSVHIERLFDCYGPKRCLWGSDLTNCFAIGSYRQRVTHFTEELPFLNESDKDWVMGRSTLETLGWTDGREP